jgi:glutathione synthase/RimK-type ligase-like ATP-grasp enzyme
MRPRVALVTCAEVPGLDPDDRAVLEPLAARGLEAEAAVWDDPAVDWDAYELALLRSPWDYVGRREAFVAWAGTVPRLRNPARVVEDNTDKTYLGRLAAKGVPVVPTEFVGPGGAWSGAPAPEYVVKPAISAGSRDTARYGPAEEDRARAHVDGLTAAGRTAMIQPYVASVDARGETALLFFAGAFSHAIRKGPILEPGAPPPEGLYATEDITPRDPEPDEREVAEAVLDACGFPREDLVYARVDLVRGDDDTPLLLELELTEPSLFLTTAAGAPERLADAVAAAL